MDRNERMLTPLSRRPSTPGEMLAGLFMEPLKMTQADLADRMGVSRRRVNELVNGRRGVTAETAVLLSAVFGTTPQLWINAQQLADKNKFPSSQ